METLCLKYSLIFHLGNIYSKWEIISKDMSLNTIKKSLLAKNTQFQGYSSVLEEKSVKTDWNSLMLKLTSPRLKTSWFLSVIFLHTLTGIIINDNLKHFLAQFSHLLILETLAEICLLPGKSADFLGHLGTFSSSPTTTIPHASVTDIGIYSFSLSFSYQLEYHPVISYFSSHWRTSETSANRSNLEIVKSSPLRCRLICFTSMY